MTAILQKENAVLRKKSTEVNISGITKPTMVKILKAMKTALDEQEDGVAIAAPQIGESLRVFIVSEKVFELSEDIHERREEQKQLETKAYKHLVFINPVLTKLSREKKLLEEGCLSVRWFYGKVKRSIKATIRAYDEHGTAFERGASGLMAQVFQHEMDHLEGVLFIDKAEDIREMQPEGMGV
jgi:peptide deformylase